MICSPRREEVGSSPSRAFRSPARVRASRLELRPVMLRALGERSWRDAVGLEIDHDQRAVLLKEAVHHALQRIRLRRSPRHKARGALKQREAVFPPGPPLPRGCAPQWALQKPRQRGGVDRPACSGVSRRRSSMLFDCGAHRTFLRRRRESRNCSAACIAVPCSAA